MKETAAVRRLAVIAYSFSAAAFLLVFLRLRGWTLLAAGGLLLLPGLLLIPGSRASRRRAFLGALCLGMALSCFGYYRWDRAVLQRAERLAEQSRTVEATVLDYPEVTGSGCRVSARVEGLKCLLYLKGRSDFEPGARISVNARFRLTEERTDSEYFLSVGVPLFGYARTEAVPLRKAGHPWRYLPARLGHALRENAAAAAGSEAAPFLKAILTGDRSELKADTYFYAMLREAGVLHCVAVSGMHLAFLVSFLAVLLGKGKHTALICIPVVLLFMAVAGFSASVVRAGIMQLAVCGAILLDREYDGHTALALAVALLAALNPGSTHNVGLLLSFLSTLGILLFSERLGKALPHLPGRTERRFPGSMFRYVRSSLAVSLSALVLTLPVNAAVFGQIPLMAPLTNLLVLWAVSACFGLGMLAALLWALWPAGAAVLGWPLRLLVRYIAFVVKGIGRLPFASLYPETRSFALWLICLYGLMTAFRFIPGIRRRLLGFLLSAVLLLSVSGGAGWCLSRSGSLCTAVLDVGQGQCVLLCGRDFTVLYDCGSLNSRENAGDLAARYLLSRFHRRVDALVISHFDSDHMNGALELMRRLPVKRLILPPPDAAGERLTAEAAALGVQVITVTDLPLQAAFGGLQAVIVPPLGLTGDNEEGLCALFGMDDFEVLLTGDASAETELRLLSRLTVPDTELLVAGHHGSAGSNTEALLAAAAPDAVVVSVGRNNYGLPSEEALDRLEGSGAAVHRTDLEGTVEIRYRRRKGSDGRG